MSDELSFKPEDKEFERSSVRSNPLLAFIRILALVGLSFLYYLLVFIFKLLTKNPKNRYRTSVLWTRRWARACRFLMGIQVTYRGKIPDEGCLLTPNHQGYADIIALASLVPCFFVAKMDVGSWPLIASLYHVGDHILVPRSRAKDLLEATKEMKNRLVARFSVCAFLEGTSTGGDRILPFYPPLAQPAIDAGVPAVPVAIRWSAKREGIIVSEDIAYWKDHHFASHAWRLLGLTGIQVEILFGEPVPPGSMDRKAFAEKLHTTLLNLYDPDSSTKNN